MSIKFKTAAIALLTVASLSTTGCFWITTQGPNLGPFSIPIPISPYFQDGHEVAYKLKSRYDKAPLLGPLVEGGPCQGVDTPSDDECIEALESARPVRGGLPFLDEKQRNNVRFAKYKIADFIDPPRVYPLIGPAQLHHVRYKIVINFEETTRVGWPIPYTLQNDEAQEVVYIDHDHFHMVGNPEYGPGSGY
ncbi:MAG: hypothetical protein SGJ20_19315 [Planctomycetota bacterium]|nr:hypothetical protein [Planctomycetota bacterium]